MQNSESYAFREQMLESVFEELRFKPVKAIRNVHRRIKSDQFQLCATERLFQKNKGIPMHAVQLLTADNALLNPFNVSTTCNTNSISWDLDSVLTDKNVNAIQNCLILIEEYLYMYRDEKIALWNNYGGQVPLVWKGKAYGALYLLEKVVKVVVDMFSTIYPDYLNIMSTMEEFEQEPNSQPIKCLLDACGFNHHMIVLFMAGGWFGSSITKDESSSNSVFGNEPEQTVETFTTGFKSVHEIADYLAAVKSDYVRDENRFAADYILTILKRYAVGTDISLYPYSTSKMFVGIIPSAIHSSHHAVAFIRHLFCDETRNALNDLTNYSPTEEDKQLIRHIRLTIVPPEIAKSNRTYITVLTENDLCALFYLIKRTANLDYSKHRTFDVKDLSLQTILKQYKLWFIKSVLMDVIRKQYCLRTQSLIPDAMLTDALLSQKVHSFNVKEFNNLTSNQVCKPVSVGQAVPDLFNLPLMLPSLNGTSLDLTRKFWVPKLKEGVTPPKMNHVIDYFCDVLTLMYDHLLFHDFNYIDELNDTEQEDDDKVIKFES